MSRNAKLGGNLASGPSFLIERIPLPAGNGFQAYHNNYMKE
jgi:hypothetical protein